MQKNEVAGTAFEADAAQETAGRKAAGISRRSFLGGAALASMAAVTAGMAGCSSGPKVVSEEEAAQQLSGTSSTASATTTDWLGEPPAFTTEDCVETLEFDVVVCGSAVAASGAAFKAAKEGGHVAVLEKHTVTHNCGPTMAFCNAQYGQTELGMPELDPHIPIQGLYQETQETANKALFSLWANRSGAIFDEYLQEALLPWGVEVTESEQGVKDDSNPRLYKAIGMYRASYNIGANGGEHGAMDYNDAIKDYVIGKGGEYFYSTKAEVLVQDDDGTVTGVIATNPQGDLVYYKAAKGVVVATGGFGHDENMTRTFLAPELADLARDMDNYMSNTLEPSDGPINTGDGQKMLCWAGGVMKPSNCSGGGQWNLSSGYLGSPYFSVNQLGKRFMDESTTNVGAVNQLLATNHDKGYYFWNIASVPTVDREVMPNMYNMQNWILDLYNEGNTVYDADTLEELAELMDVPADVFVAEVERYNTFVESGFDEDYMKIPEFLVDPIKEPPFRASMAKICFSTTWDGVEVSRKMEVLNAAGEPIPHLYAAGNCVGRRFGHGYDVHITGISNGLASTTGYLAAESAMEN